jgi:hypothetical protein
VRHLGAPKWRQPRLAVEPIALGSNLECAWHCLSKKSVVKSFNLAFELDQQRVAFAVQGFAGRHFDPTFTDAVFLHIGAFFAIESNANVVLKHCRHIKRAAGINGQMVGKFGA